MPKETAWKRFLDAVFSLFRGEPSLLLPFDWVKDQVRIKGWRYRGLEEVELEKIVGSVNRYRDFDRAFLPRGRPDERLKHLERAAQRGEVFPPVKLYKLGEAYFVIDGHHRVAAARRQGGKYIDAEVFEFIPDVPIYPTDTEKDLLLKAEYSGFLRHTRLDELRPGQEILLSELGGYRKLLEHIDVHRYFLGLEEKRDIPYEEAVASWYDRVYTPIVEAIRRTGILQQFPGRTEADLYVWLSEHIYYLAEETGRAPDLEKAALELAEMLGVRKG